MTFDYEYNVGDLIVDRVTYDSFDIGYIVCVNNFDCVHIRWMHDKNIRDINILTKSFISKHLDQESWELINIKKIL